jgi:hypothetical protein
MLSLSLQCPELNDMLRVKLSSWIPQEFRLEFWVKLESTDFYCKFLKNSYYTWLCQLPLFQKAMRILPNPLLYSGSAQFQRRESSLLLFFVTFQPAGPAEPLEGVGGAVGPFVPSPH